MIQSIEQIDCKELYEQTKRNNILIREDFKQLLAINEQLLQWVEQFLKFSFGSKNEHYLASEQIPGQLCFGLAEELAIVVTLPKTSKAIADRPRHSEKEKKKHFVIADNPLNEVRKSIPRDLPRKVDV